MTSIDVFKQVTATRQFVLAKPKAGKRGQYDVKTSLDGDTSGWVLVDLFSASTVMTVYNNLERPNRKLLASFDIHRAVEISLKVTK